MAFDIKSKLEATSMAVTRRPVTLSTKMKFTACIGIFTLILSAAIVKGLPTSPLQDATANKVLLDYLLSPDTVNAAADPAATAACFAKYLPVLSEIANTYSTQYQACITQAEAETQTLIDNASTNRTNFIQSTQDVCTAFTNCNTDTDILGFFDCYASVSSQDVSVLYTLSTNATAAAATLSKGLRLIQEEKNQCINTTENTYVENTADTYKLLNGCLESADASTVGPPTFAPVNTNVLQAVRPEELIVQTDCSNGSGTRTQISPDGSQTQTQTGPGCQSQSSGSSSSGSQSQSQSGSGTQYQCNGAECGEMKPLFTMATMAPMAPMAPMKPFN